MNYSKTQAGNLAVIIGMIMLVLKYFQVEIAEEEIQTLIGGGLAIVGVLVSWYGRWKVGDLKFLGGRKPKLDL